MKIIRISKKNKANVLIEFENSEILILALEIFIKSGLRKNDELSADRFSNLIDENKLFYIKQRAFRLLGRRSHSTGELRRKLLEKMYDKNLVESVIEELKAKNYLDDEEFVNLFVQEKIHNKKWSKKKIHSELIKHNINQQLIEKILKENFSADEDFKNAVLIAQKKLNSLSKRNLNENELKEKLITFLMARGFNYSTIKKVYEELIQ